jgi:hypothetical protein
MTPELGRILALFRLPWNTDVGCRPVCTESLNQNVVVMKSAKDGVRFDVSGPLNRSERPAHLYPMTGHGEF